ncbi:hypothetical protein PRIPAC_75550 [Pristionchus pacificus]|uniref:Uncharacterized protein n=1 Tax=Pristionchus pacificus TaxID=54126 RepID=A0A2A6BWH5_PRIPA|nr:hypothetical protein PRIPAC_75550 [Pristionchus pacificus]|eukprot:PDM70207.1 hypothetical protein PRIPAC_45511 [Pristionchus pacificus]
MIRRMNNKLIICHLPSPYLRRYRLPQLSSRPFEDLTSPDDQEGKMAIIISKMESLSRQPSTSRNNERKEEEIKMENESIRKEEKEDAYRPPLPPHGMKMIQSDNERIKEEENKMKKKKKRRKKKEER